MSQPCEIEMIDVAEAEHFAGLAIFDLVAGGARRCDHRHFVRREFPFGEDVQHLAPDIARRADDHDPVAHLFSP
jgi:hypothetical protein